MNPPVPAGRRCSPFTAPVNAALIGGVLVLFLGVNIWLISERHEARRIAQAACAAQTRAEIAQKPILAYTVRFMDECQTLRAIRGEQP